MGNGEWGMGNWELETPQLTIPQFPISSNNYAAAKPWADIRIISTLLKPMLLKASP